MFSLFNPQYVVRRTPATLPMFDYLLRQIQGETQKTIDFYHRNLYRSPNTTKIAKYLYEVSNYLDLTPEALVAYIRDNTHRLCNAYGFTSPISRGKIHDDGELYNRNTPEVYICVEYDFSIDKCQQNWRALQPLRILSHEFTDFSYCIPNGQYRSQQIGLCVASIDLALMALQFQTWWNTERYVESEKLYLPHTHFVNKYVLCNALYSHMDQVMFNRFNHIVLDQPIPAGRATQSFLTIDYGDRIDDVLSALKDSLLKNPKDWRSILASLPSLKYGDYLSSILFPDVAPTLNIKWALVLSKLKVLETVMAMDDQHEHPAISGADQLQIRRELNVLLNDRSLALFLPQTVMSRIQQLFEKVKQST